jgi:hypothetical protein
MCGSASNAGRRRSVLILLYRTLPPEQHLPQDQRWRVIEIDPHLSEGLDSNAPTFESSVIRRVNEGRAEYVNPIPFGADVHIADTDTLSKWTLELRVEKA